MAKCKASMGSVVKGLRNSYIWHKTIEAKQSTTAHFMLATRLLNHILEMD